MRKLFFLFGFILFTTNGCNDNKAVSESNFINDAFLVLIDTFAYKYKSLRPAPNSLISNKNDSLNITIYNKLKSFDDYESEIKILLINFKEDQDYYNLFLSQFKKGLTRDFNVNKIQKHGKYIISENKVNHSRKIKNVAGNIFFSMPIIDNFNTKAIILTEVNDNGNSEIIKLHLLKKIHNNWAIIKYFIISVS